MMDAREAFEKSITTRNKLKFIDNTTIEEELDRLNSLIAEAATKGEFEVKATLEGESFVFTLDSIKQIVDTLRKNGYQVTYFPMDADFSKVDLSIFWGLYDTFSE